MRRVRRLGAPGPDVNCPAGWLFHVGTAILGLNPLGRKSVRHGSSFQTSAVLPRWPRKRWGWGGVSLVYLAWDFVPPHPRPQLLIMEGRKGAWLMTVTQGSQSSVLCGHLCELGSQMGPSFHTLRRGSLILWWDSCVLLHDIIVIFLRIYNPALGKRGNQIHDLVPEVTQLTGVGRGLTTTYQPLGF